MLDPEVKVCELEYGNVIILDLGCTEVQVMETSLRVSGQEHPSTLTSMANLASTYRNQGRWTEAEELQAIKLAICSRGTKGHTQLSIGNMAELSQVALS
jgi:hypothetical protein